MYKIISILFLLGHSIVAHTQITTFNSYEFSIDMKAQKSAYLDKEPVETEVINAYLNQLKTVDLSLLKTDNDKIAFWINMYNGLMCYWIIEKKIKKNVLEVSNIFSDAKVNIGGYEWSLDDIEHGILRCNAGHPAKFFTQFNKKDKRKDLIVKKLDYRLHFALNCGGVSCPAIGAYSSEKLEAQLLVAEKSFAEQEFKVNDKTQTIECSKIFWWYKGDFKGVYLNDARYKSYKVVQKDYSFDIK